ncbi:FKBP-type peptidyl-prolyl cis-trans isomerase [Nonomuraea soli]|uniref:Peptidyl-prolyl cis-trans isomerase n=1 Tax=Nonomuraea soli TaxID=1032476 RepID=A0A7W0HUM0_9ACTN|nr:FKBP-type peptidyl-prolyl cis-trans isomerase [Nonomuraea soli]MBA2896122.1 peptidylprolyl isomerase [Nonomuraea soli]
MRRRLAVLAAVPLLFAAACGSGSADSLQINGKLGAKPEAVFPAGDPVKVSSYQIIDPGKGAAFAKGQTVNAHYTVWDWDGKENKQRISSYTSSDTSPIKIDDRLPKVMLEGFTKTKAGGRFLAVVGPDSMSKEAAEAAKQAGEDPNKTQVFVIDPISAMPSAASGTETGEKVDGVTVVNPGGDKAPTLTTKTDLKPPTELISKVLITGTGAKVKETDTVLAHYTGKIWGTDKQFDSSWERGESAEFSLDGVIPGWKQGLKDVPAGSRVLLVIPPALGYGDQEQNGIPAKSTLVFVVDVLYGG